MIGLGISAVKSIVASGLSSPLDIDGLMGYFDFSTLSGNDGDACPLPVTNLGSAGSASNVTAINGGPLINDSLLSLRSLDFDGVNDRVIIDTNMVTTGKPMTLFAVFNSDNGTADCFFTKDTVDGSSQLRMDTTSTFTFRSGGVSPQTITTNNTDNGSKSYTYTAGVQEVLVIRRDSDGTWYMYNKLGDFIGLQDSATAQSGADFEWGVSGDIGDSDFNGSIGEIGMYDADIGAAKASELAQFLNAKWS